MHKITLSFLFFLGTAPYTYGSNSGLLTTYQCKHDKKDTLVFTLSNSKNEVINKVKDICVSASRHYENSGIFTWKSCDLRIDKKKATSIVFTSNVCSYYFDTKSDQVEEHCDFSVEGAEPPPPPIFKCEEIKLD